MYSKNQIEKIVNQEIDKLEEELVKLEKDKVRNKKKIKIIKKAIKKMESNTKFAKDIAIKILDIYERSGENNG